MEKLTTHFACLLLATTCASAQVQTPGTTCGYAVDSSRPDGGAPWACDADRGGGGQPLVPVISFDEDPITHNMHITSDGSYYYTINGASASSGQISKFSLTGTLVQTYPVQIDGRGLSYDASTGFLYSSEFGGGIVKIEDLSTGSFSSVYPQIMQNAQASFALSPDGSKFYDFYQGTLIVRDFTTAVTVATLSGLSCGSGNYGGNAAVAVDAAHIYTWDAATRTVYCYDMTGVLVQTYLLDSGDNGHSISIANNKLFVSRDGNGGVGTWYGYDLSGGTSVAEVGNAPRATAYPNPTDNVTALRAEKGGHGEPYVVSDPTGRQIRTGSITGVETVISLDGLRAGVYTVQIGPPGGQVLRVVKR